MVPTTNPLDALPPIALPEVPGWWPPAPGWWILALLFLGAAILLTCLLIKRHRQLALKKTVTKRLDDLYASLIGGKEQDASISRQNFIDHSAVLLRQFCIQQYGPEFFASVTGEQWLEKMDTLANGNYLNNSAGKLLLKRYRNQAEPELDELVELYNVLNRWLADAPTNPQATGQFKIHNLLDRNSNAIVHR